MQLPFNIRHLIFLTFSFIMFTVEGGSVLNIKTGGHPILDVSSYIDAILKNEHANSKEIFTKFLEKEISPILYFEADIDKHALERLASLKIREMIDEIDKKNALNYTRQLVISLRTHTSTSTEDVFQQIANLNQHHDASVQTERNVNGVVIDLQNLSPASCDLFNFTKNKNSSLFSTMKQLLRELGIPQTQVGFGYNKNLSNCSNLGEKAEIADFYVLTLDFETEVGFAESYGIFKNYLKFVLSKTKQFFEVNIDPQPEVTLRVNLKVHNGKYNEAFRSYQKLLHSFIKKWQSEYGKNVIFNVVDDFENSAMLHHEENVESTTVATSNIVPFLFRSVSPHEYSPSNCYKFGRRLNHVATKFVNLHLDFDAWLDIILQCRSQAKTENHCKLRYFPKNWKDIIRNQNSTQGHNVKECTIDNVKLNGLSKITLLIKLKSCYKNSCDSIHQVFDLLESNYEIYGMSVKGLIFLLDDKRINVSIAEVQKMIPKDVSIGCKTDFGHLESVLDENFQPKSITCPIRVPNRPEVSIWNFSIDLKKAFDESFSFDFYTRSIQPYLQKLAEMITELRKLEPGTDVILRIIKTTPNEFNWKSDNNLFCNNAIVGSNLLFEAIANWAAIHNIRVILKPAFDAGTVFGWWSSIESKEFVTRNNPYYSSFGRDPCVNWIDGSSGRIQFGAKNKNGGELITLDMGIREECNTKQQLNSTRTNTSLSMDELKVMLTFGFHVFPKIELLPRAKNLTEFISDLDTITELLLESNVSDYFQLNQINNGSLVITLPVQFLSEAEGKVKKLLTISRSSNSSLLTIEALHIDGVRILCSNDTSRRITPAIFQGTSGFHCVNQVDLRRNLDLFKELRLEDTQIGLIYRCFNCPMTLAQISGIEEEWVQMASYIHLTYLDKVATIRFPDKRGVQAYSDRQLKIKRAFLSQYPHLTKTSFRPVMQTRVGKKEDYGVTITRYLSYISHDTRYGEAYNINSFVNGFQYKCMQVDGKQKLYKYGWWQISNHDDLTDTNVYSEMQSDYLKQETWRPQRENVSESGNTVGVRVAGSPSFLWLVFLISGLSVVIFFCLFWGVYRLRSRVQVLSGKEVREFYEGVEGEGYTPGEEDNAESQDNSYRRQKFDEKFEIAKSEFFQGERHILGMGNFGTVYKTLVKGINVAVKVPHENCSKDSFRSMLIEVKILSFLGKHPNIVGFVGCYTKEISAGVIYIATELCERDSLQNFLRKELGRKESVDPVRMEELLRFSLEIASGMDYIGGKYVIHGDLSTRNVLLDGNLTCKIGDFGLSRKLYDYTKYVKTSQGPLPWRWMAYESLVKMEFTTKSDVWSYGVTLWEIYSLGAIPYPGLSWTVDFVDDLKKGFRMNAPEYATEEMYLKIRTCWNFYPETRPSFGELSEFFLQLRNQLLYTEIRI